MDGLGGSVEPNMTELRGDEGSQCEEPNASKNVKFSIRKKKSLRARYAYGVIFLLTNIIAWLFRDYGERILPVLPCKFENCLFSLLMEAPWYWNLSSSSRLRNIRMWSYWNLIWIIAADSKACGAEERECYHTMGVLRVSLGCFVSFSCANHHRHRI